MTEKMSFCFGITFIYDLLHNTAVMLPSVFSDESYVYDVDDHTVMRVR